MSGWELAGREVTIEPSEAVLELQVDRPADRRVVVAVVVIGVAGDVAIRSGFVTAGGAVAGAAASAALLASGRIVRPQAQLLIGVAPAFTVWLALRASPWLVPLDVIAALAVFALGVTLARSGSLFDLAPRNLADRGLHSLAHAGLAPLFVAAPLRGRRSGAVARGILVAAPLVVVIAALLASADAVFASLLGTDSLDGGDVIVHIILFTIAAWAGAAMLRITSAPEPAPLDAPRRWFGHIEAMVVLIAIATVLGVFAVVQAFNLFSASERILETRGLTYAEYARTGFFQLLWVAGIVMSVLLGLRAVTRIDSAVSRRAFVVAADVVLLLTLVVVAVSIVRLGLYQREFGLTMLRLYSTVAAYEIGMLVVLVGLAIAGVGARRVWLPGATIVTVLVTILGVNMLNPEAFVARVNLERGAALVDVDGAYLTDLSDDAVPEIVAHLDQLDAANRQIVVAQLCDRDADRGGRGWASVTRSQARALAALESVC